jgi:glycosyltransferase involved in cell wall biosynthesis
VKQRILHILTSPRAEGTPRLVLDCLTVSGPVQGVLCLSDDPAELESDLRAASAWMTVTDVVRPGLAKYRDIPRAVAKACEEFRPDVVIGWPTWTAGLIALGVRRVGGAKLIQHCGNPARQEWGARLTADLRFLPFYAAGGRFACCSDYVRDAFRRRTPFFKSRFQTVYNCIRAGEIAARAAKSRENRGTRAGLVLLMVATMEDHKDHATLLRAVADIAPRIQGLEVQLAGEGRLRPKLENLARELRIEPIVRFLGSRKDVPELLGQADLFVFSTTRQEGLGIVLLEALAARVPVVASDVPACRELLKGGRLGELVSPENPTALATAIEHKLTANRRNDPDEIDQVRVGAEHAATFTPSQMLAEYLTHAGILNLA